MHLPSQYQLGPRLYRGRHSVVHRGVRLSDQLPVVFKSPRSEFPGPAEHAQFRAELAFLQQIDSSGVIRALELIDTGTCMALVLEDFGARSLSEFVAHQPLDVLPFLEVAIQLATGLAAIHRAGIIHRDLSPANLVYNPDTLVAKIIDFGLATVRPSDPSRTMPPERIVGTLAFMSPEQTGRTHHGVDHRTDLYALGCCAFHLLTGRRPFECDQPMAMVHAHLAESPPDVRTVAQRDVPPAVAEIIGKLLQKSAGERYQSAEGLLVDLRRCRDLLVDRGSVPSFHLGTEDVSDTLAIPRVTCGREAESEILRSALERVLSGATEMIAIAGESGMGKTALVDGMREPAVSVGGVFARGGFQTGSARGPYGALAELLRQLVEPILLLSEDELKRWRGWLADAVGPNGRLIVNILPEASALFDEPPRLSTLPARAAQRRFNQTVSDFLRVFAYAEHPLILFFDDVHLADASAIEFIEQMVLSDDTGHLLVLVAYRPEEVDVEHPLADTLARLRATEVSLGELALRPLAQADVARLLGATLNSDPESCLPLAALLENKAGGNPFHTLEIVRVLYQRGLLQPDCKSRADRGTAGVTRWRWDLDGIRALTIPDSVADILSYKAEEWPLATRALVGTAACLGQRFSVRMLAVAADMSPGEIVRALQPSAMDGILIARGSGHERLRATNDDGAIGRELAILAEYEFTHQRFKEVLGARLVGAEGAAVYGRIGRRLLDGLDPDEREQHLYTLVDSLNTGTNQVTEENRRAELAELNLRAGQKAVESAAFERALGYFAAGIDWLADGASDASAVWNERYALALALHQGAATAGYAVGQFDVAEEFASAVLRRGETLLDRLPALEVTVRVNMAQRRLHDALELALDGLAQLGVRFPKRPGMAGVTFGFVRTKVLLARHSHDRLLAAEPMTDPHKLTAMRLMYAISIGAYQIRPMLVPHLVFRQLELSVKHGNAPESAVAYSMFGLMLCAITGQVDIAMRYADLACALIERPGLDRLACRTELIVHGFIRVWTAPIRDTIEPMRAAYRRGLQAGDLQSVLFAYFQHGFHALLAGRPLSEVRPIIDGVTRTSERVDLRVGTVIDYIYQQFMHNLGGECEHPERLAGKFLDVDESRAILEAENDQSGLFNLYWLEMWNGLLFAEIAGARVAADRAAKHLSGIMGSPLMFWYSFLDALICLRPADVGRRDRRRARRQLARLRKWARREPLGIGQHAALVAAELARVEGRDLRAMRLYEDAIRAAEKLDNWFLLGLANELAGRFHRARGFRQIGESYLRAAHYAWMRWGASNKAELLSREFPHLQTQRLGPGLAHGDEAVTSPMSPPSPGDDGDSWESTSQSISVTTSESGRSLAGTLDINMVVQALQAISQELVFDDLLAKLLAITLESSGAGRGLVLLPGAQGWQVAARDDRGRNASTDTHDDRAFPTSMVKFVSRTKNASVVEDTTSPHEFSRDRYFQTASARSVLCVPLVHQSELVGLLYLENDLTPGAFNLDRLGVLELLAAQAAIAITNASLYRRVADTNRTLEERVAERTDEIARASVEARRAREAAERANAAKSRFLSHISHEIRTPMNAIVGLSQLLLKSELNLEQADMMQTIWRGCETLLALLNDILDLSKIEAGKMEMAQEPVDLLELIDDLVRLMQPTAASKGLALTREFDAATPACIEGDALRLRQILTNLMSNAIKFTDAGGVSLRVAMDQDDRDGDDDNDRADGRIRLHFSVRDTGAGIAEERLDELFTSFTQVHGPDQRDKGGTGLGLAISKQLVEMMGGRIWAESQLGQGSTFHVTIATRASRRPFARAAQPAQRPVERRTERPGGPSAPARILIVDDNTVNRRVVRAMLQRAGYPDADMAHDGREALELVRRGSYALVFMDVHMPQMDGLAATRAIRADASIGQQPHIIALTADVSRDDVKACTDAGMDSYLSKPLLYDALLETLDKTTGSRLTGS